VVIVFAYALHLVALLTIRLL